MARFARKLFIPLAFVPLFAVLFCLTPPPAAAGDGEVTLGTQSGQAAITTDPATGDRVMRTPEPRPQQEYQGPQTIIVAPEVYPGGRPGAGQRPPQRPPQHRPPNRPQPR